MLYLFRRDFNFRASARNGCLKRPGSGWGLTAAEWELFATRGGGHKANVETHSQAPIKNRKKFLLKEVEFNETNTTDTGKLGVGGKSVAKGFRSDGDTCKDEPVDSERGNGEMLKAGTDPVNVVEE